MNQNILVEMLDFCTNRKLEHIYFFRIANFLLIEESEKIFESTFFLLIEEAVFWRGVDILPSEHTLNVLDFALIENLNIAT